MNVLIVYAHPEPKSFNGAMIDMAVETPGNAGHEVVVSDFDVLPPFTAYMPGRIRQSEREANLDAYRKRLLELDTIPKFFFHPAEDYGPNERLKPGVLAHSGVQLNV